MASRFAPRQAERESGSRGHLRAAGDEIGDDAVDLAVKIAIDFALRRVNSAAAGGEHGIFDQLHMLERGPLSYEARENLFERRFVFGMNGDADVRGMRDEF